MMVADFTEVVQASRLFAAYDRPWAVCGGWAIDLFLNYVTRHHKDIDFAILRRDQSMAQEYLVSRGWTLEKAVDGALAPWPKGEWLDPPTHTIWCKNQETSPTFVELLLNDSDGDNFLFRRDPSITLPLENMTIRSTASIPILAPEIVLLYKFGDAEMSLRTGELETVLANLPSSARGWLSAALRKLHPDHPSLRNF